MTRRRLPISPRPMAALAALAVGVATLVPGLQSPATAAPVSDGPTATSAASAWLSAAAPTGVLTTGGIADWGLTADGVFAHAAGGRGPTAGAVATTALEAHVQDFASNPAGTGRNAGSIAKLLVVAVVQGRDVTSFGGWNLRAELLARLTTDAGDNFGRFRSVGVPDTTNGFTQALAVIGLARSGGVPVDAVTYLDQQQCPSGGFRLFYLGAGCTTDAAADVDATAIAVQALLTAKAAGVAGTDGPTSDALDWLEVMQGVDGSFTASGPNGVPNTNSTGLSSQALRAGGRTEAADRGAQWIRSLQLDCADDVAASAIGAIAYGPTAHASTLAAGDIEDLYADQFMRTTTEGILGLGAPSFATLSGTSSSDGPVGFDCDTPPGPTSTTTTTTTTGPTSTTTSTTSTSPSSTSTSTTAPRSTTTIGAVISATSSTQLGAQVEGISQQSGSSRSGSGSSVSSGSGSSGGGLAVTGVGAGRLALSALAFAVSGGLFLEARRRSR